jgi:lipopolysaccharide/colanic/teichoic acid biosynthesis glycosyltransferase
MFIEVNQREPILISKDSFRYLKIRRYIELFLILLFSPFICIVFVFVSALVISDGHKKIFFKQKRIGFQEKEFEIYKFRTIKNSNNNISKTGEFIRRHRLDEVPQIINILKGDLYLIGPRPEVAEEYFEFKNIIPQYHIRKMIPQGITGWAQVNHPHSATAEGNQKKLDYDKYYIKNLSLKLDFKIVLKTIRYIFTGQIK